MVNGKKVLLSEVLPFAAMVGAECSTVGLNILFKAATLRGMSYNIFNAYSFAISTLCDWSCNNSHWVLCCDMGKSKRKSNGG
ncbi:hypothetical protein SLEP1_g10147 [Rubroshorea leprosula]|uniref:Uncharacterized protein n=1 Tax=Rubroshorea leprosula TaxID=152421 RepID=A0AAV5I764_9ROSI|nr:hypothetical protein SLEP1_g10147 [Rubroshorea leprosula]